MLDSKMLRLFQDLRLLKTLISNTFCSEQLNELFAYFQGLLWCSWGSDMWDVFVRSVKRGQVVLQLEHGLTSRSTRNSLRTIAGSAYTAEAAASKVIIVLAAIHPHLGGVVEGQFLSLVDVTDCMGDKSISVGYVVNLQVRDAGVVDAAGQWEDSRAACLLVTESYHICLIDGMKFDHRFDLVSIGEFCANRCLFEVSLGFVNPFVYSDCGVRVMVEFEASFVLLRRKGIEHHSEFFNIKNG